jgi:hypothetical protein
VITQEMDFTLREKEEEIEHYKTKCEKSQKREEKQKERMKREIETIR